MNDRKVFLEESLKQPEQQAARRRLSKVEAAERQNDKAMLFYPQIFHPQRPMSKQVTAHAAVEEVQPPADVQGTIIDNIRDRRVAEARQMLDDAFNPATPGQSVTSALAPQPEPSAQIVALDERRQQAEVVRQTYSDVLGREAA